MTRVSDLFEKFSIESNRRSTGDFELTLRSWIRYVRAWRGELRRRHHWRDRLRAWPLGFKVKNYRLHNIQHRDPALFVADFSLARHATEINGFWNPIIGNKLVISYIAQAIGVPVPAVLGCLIDGRALSFDGTTPTDLLAALDNWVGGARRLVFRPHWSGGGEGVFFVHREQGQWHINDRPAELHELRLLLGALHRYLVTEWVQQATYARRIFPRTANTLRVLTLRDAEGPFVSAVVHRFGSSRSFPVDNFHAGRGGLTAMVDLESGTLQPALGVDGSGRLVPHERHPETNEQIAGVLVPHFREALEGMLRLCQALPEGRWVGWDALMTDDGYSILEANSLPSLDVWQVHQPLLAEARTARFFAEHGVQGGASRK
jgi:hypothetical protein